MDEQVPVAVMDERLKRLQDQINSDQIAFNTASIGRVTDVLLERAGRHPGQIVGKSPWLQSVHVEDADATIGDMVTVELVSAGPNSMAGRVVARAAA